MFLCTGLSIHDLQEEVDANIIVAGILSDLSIHDLQEEVDAMEEQESQMPR